MRLPLWLALSGALTFSSVSCRNVDVRLESLVNSSVCQIENEHVFPADIDFECEDAVLNDSRFRESVEKNLVSLLSGSDWRDVLFYCSANKIDFSSAAVDAMNDSFSHFHHGQDRLPSFIAECLKYDTGILWKPAIRHEVIKKLDAFMPFLRVSEVSVVESVFRNYPGEQDYFRKQMLFSLARRLDSGVWKEARRLALELPVVLEQEEYARLAADVLENVQDAPFVTYPSYSSAMEAVALCQKFDAELVKTSPALLEKILAVFDKCYNPISLAWVCEEYKSKGLISVDAVRRTLLTFLDAHKEYDDVGAYATLVAGVEIPAERDVFLIKYADSGIRSLSEVFSLVSEVKNPVLQREFLRASFFRFMRLQTAESYYGAVYIASFYSVLQPLECEELADVLLAGKFINYDDDDPFHDDGRVVPSFDDVGRALFLFKKAGVEGLSDDRINKIVYALSVKFADTKYLIDCLMRFDVPFSSFVADSVLGIRSHSGDDVLSLLFARGFLPSENIAQEYCNSVLDGAVVPITAVASFVSHYQKEPFVASQYVDYGVRRLSRKSLNSDDVRNAAFAFEHGVKIKDGRRPGSIEFITTLESVLDNPEIDSEAVLNVFSALNYSFDFSRRLSVVDSLPACKKIGEVTKLYYHARTTQNFFVEDKLKHSLVLNIKSARDFEIQQCVYFLSESESSSAYISLLGDFLFEQGRVLSARFCWEKSGYRVGVDSVDKILARKDVVLPEK